MMKFAIRFFTVAAFGIALIAAPLLTPVHAAGDDNPAPPASSPKKDKKGKRSSLEQDRFSAGYRAAYTTIYDRHDYASAIEQLKALGHDEMAAVANLIGYSYRKLGDYQSSKVYYELALKDDPNHVRTWQYYGLWQLEQGNREQAQYHLNKIASLAGTGSSEYRSLADALDRPTGAALVY